MKVLISGKNGFIGSQLARHLELLRMEVIGLMRELLAQTEALKAYIDDVKPDYIFHLGAYGNMASQTGEQEIFQANVVNTWNLLSATKDTPYKLFINFGSSSEYGKKTSPMTERDLPETETFYGASKVAGTYLARAFAKQFNKPIVTVRPFSVYGPREADFRFIPTVIRSLITGQEMNLDPLPVHDWIYIDDLIFFVTNLMSFSKDLHGDAVNIGSGKCYSNAEVVEMLENISGRKATLKIVEKPMRSDSGTWQSAWGVQGRSLHAGLKLTYEYFKHRFEAENNRN